MATTTKTASAKRPRLAPPDPLGRRIQAVLKLIRPENGVEPSPAFDGYGPAATEAYLHLAGGRESGLRVVRAGTGAEAHWWLVDELDRVIDLTLSPADRPGAGAAPDYPYERGRGAMFRTGYNKPSKRAAAIIALAERFV